MSNQAIVGIPSQLANMSRHIQDTAMLVSKGGFWYCKKFNVNFWYNKKIGFKIFKDNKPFATTKDFWEAKTIINNLLEN